MLFRSVLKSTQEIGSWFKKVALIYETNGKALVKSANLAKKKKTYTCSVEIGCGPSAIFSLCRLTCAVGSV